ncbi:hypothetical protein [Candidatus Methylacidithermus pantelleriae]|uniref:Uncharacterized protein n=1 Tax=Candidatus Methylacidithermus pantelleriae TaxID=2744239 RepID=A0A8J2FTJ5_9BACT|nr:hypothetical protein [Candidatus Methylacidithermus pantelleriae]CAF0705048.1 hypothetical protein MPNT_80084 [Candidatus Methylacidithermus pantelleriae]
MEEARLELESVDPVWARSLFSFAYRQGDRHGSRRLFSIGVEVTELNPACTSVINAVNHALRHSASFH